MSAAVPHVVHWGARPDRAMGTATALPRESHAVVYSPQDTDIVGIYKLLNSVAKKNTSAIAGLLTALVGLDFELGSSEQIS